jgi:hypothetical protein
MASKSKGAAQAAQEVKAANPPEYGMIDAGGINFAVIPGHPKPYSASDPKLVGLTASIKKQGVLFPVLLDENDQVWDGRARARACALLGIPVPFKRIKSENGPSLARAALAKREWTIIERAEFIALIAAELSKSKGEGAIKQRVSAWLRENLGWEYGYGERSVQDYLNIARKSPEEKADIREAKSLHDALEKLGEVDPSVTAEGSVQEGDASQASAPPKAHIPKTDGRGSANALTLRAVKMAAIYLPEADPEKMKADKKEEFFASLRAIQPLIARYLEN